MFDLFAKLQREQRRLKNDKYRFLFEMPPDNNLVCFDCESSSFDVKKADILSIGAVFVENNRILTSRRLELFIQPSSELDEHSIKKHHLRRCDLENGLSPEVAILAFLQFIGSRPLVGYYLEFQVALLNKYIRPLLGIALPNPQIEVSGLYYDRKYGSARSHQPRQIDLRFDSMMQDLDLPVLGQHDAYNDALMTALMYLKLKHSF
ncbi:3'-5' exonuclease [Thioflexithrix psekupsensis]|uniref:DNA polymerase III subunit epsilon n=1 Tax=Thioflexithrix psekupsensis TaxID=1570016 RepID=A0A251XCC0_9GAMM|nr:3'-5' exonuclease [Thioflexithrix psekupsensis]OUD16279.1 DNA polymerase III subunit epsilon [Thioflexithrix psekupsensis]